MKKSGSAGVGMAKNKALRKKNLVLAKALNQLAMDAPSSLSPAALMALGLTGLAFAAARENASPESEEPKNLENQSSVSDVSPAKAQEALTSSASNLQMQLADLVVDLQSQTGQIANLALLDDLDAMLTAKPPQGDADTAQADCDSLVGAAEIEPILLGFKGFPSWDLGIL